MSPHSLRHSFFTAALDAGVALRDVQIAARHADPRTTTRYDRARSNLDRHASYIVVDREAERSGNAAEELTDGDVEMDRWTSRRKQPGPGRTR